MNILFADKFPADHLAVVERLGHSCSLEPDLGADDLPGRVSGFDVLVVRSTKVEAATIAAADKLKLIIRAGAGTNTIDKQAAAESGISVCNVPGKNAVAVAELTLGLILSLDRNIPDNVAELRAGRWNKKRYSETRGLFGQAIGIVGLGAIGLAVAERAAAFGCQILVLDKSGRSDETQQRLTAVAAEEVEDLVQMAERADILSFHVPAAADTRQMVNAELLARMKPGAMLINTARGDVIDEQALLSAIEDKGLRVGLDVYDGEPGSGTADFDSELARHPAVYGTHHIGASTAQAQDAVAQGVVEILEAFATGTVLHCVNR